VWGDPALLRGRIGVVAKVTKEKATYEVYELDEGGWRLRSSHGDDDSVQVESFDAMPLDLASLWE
jgi:hypothetical protein